MSTHTNMHTHQTFCRWLTDTAMQRDEGKEPASKRVGGRKNEKKRRRDHTVTERREGEKQSRVTKEL